MVDLARFESQKMGRVGSDMNISKEKNRHREMEREIIN